MQEALRYERQELPSARFTRTVQRIEMAIGEPDPRRSDGGHAGVRAYGPRLQPARR